MTGQTSKYLLATLFLFFAVQADAEDPAHPDVIPVAQEPRHRLALEDETFRLFDVRIPAGDTTFYHSHERDSIYIPISGFANLLNQEHGKAAKPLLIQYGNVAFAEHSKASFSHRVSNLGVEEFHVIDIELVGALPGSSAVGELPVGYQPVIENSRVRISRIVLEPQQSIVRVSTSTPGVIVVLNGTHMGFRKDSGTSQIRNVVPGQFYGRAETMAREIHNEGSDRLELINVEIK